ncbi:hypothetical protein JYU10_00495 [bacterium AH-315-J04]|nr:hypothetical protein [bacterium AH-315-J04]
MSDKTVADELLYSYEGDVVPWDPSAGWRIAQACEGFCTPSVDNGHFVMDWVDGGSRSHFDIVISNAIDEPDDPSTLWVEWRFRSNHLFSGLSCDGIIVLRFDRIFTVFELLGDAIISQSGNDSMLGLNPEEFHVVRFESLDGINYIVSVDGLTFVQVLDDEPPSGGFLQFGGNGGCQIIQLPTKNEWDFVRFGTISFGEQIIATDPPSGLLDARTHAGIDRFIVTFDQPNYAYIDDITVEVTSGNLPQVIQTRRVENLDTDAVEIVLDQPIPLGATTRFTFDDGVATNIVDYTFAPGDTNGDGNVNLAEYAAFQRCFASDPATGVCMALDLDQSSTITQEDLAPLIGLIETFMP